MAEVPAEARFGDDGLPTPSRQASPVWAMLGAVAAGVLLLAIRAHLADRALRDAFAALAYGAFTVAVFEGAAAVRSLVAGAVSRRRRPKPRSDTAGVTADPPGRRSATG